MSLFDKVKRDQAKSRSTPTQVVKEANQISKNTDRMGRESKFKTDNVV